MNKTKKICLITPNHIATNPRLVKEATSLSKAGYQVHVVFTQHVQEVVLDDFKILAEIPLLTYDFLNWTGVGLTAKIYRLRGGILRKAGLFWQKMFPSNFTSKIFLNRNYAYQLKAAVNSEADLFIAHNIGALAVAGDAAKRAGKAFAFDAEDYHRGESLPDDVIAAIIRMEDSYIPKANYLSAASPLIGQAYDSLYKTKAIVINNVFPIIKKPKNERPDSSISLKLFWFSQSIGNNRGIQDVFKAMRLVQHLDLEFHLYGYVPAQIKEEFDALIMELDFQRQPQIFFKGIVPPHQLLQEASNYDIGFAIEPGFCKNNEIALSNKIFTYLLGGNAIIFTSTAAQSEFYAQNPGLGYVYPPKDAKKLATIIERYFYDRHLLHQHKTRSRKLYENEFNWDKVQTKFLNLIEKCFAVQQSSTSNITASQFDV